MKYFPLLLLFPTLLFAESAPKAFAPSPIPTPAWCVQLEVKKLPGEHDLAKAMAEAKAKKQYLFIQYGRENCTNCQKVWNLLGSGAVKLPSNMAYADVSCDDPETRAVFEENFSVTDAGRLYPFIVIMGPDGSQLAFRSALGSPQDYEKLIQDAIQAYEMPLPY